MANVKGKFCITVKGVSGEKADIGTNTEAVRRELKKTVVCVVTHVGYHRHMSKDIGGGQVTRQLYKCWQSAGSNEFSII